LLNTAFNNGYLSKIVVKCYVEEPLLKGSAVFLGLTFALTFIFLLPPTTFASTDCSSYRSLISIQCFKNKNLKTEILRITNPFSSVSYIKREMSEKRERREKRDGRNKNRNSTISISNDHNF
jgi:hypothetical protein